MKSQNNVNEDNMLYALSYILADSSLPEINPFDQEYLKEISDFYQKTIQKVIDDMNLKIASPEDLDRFMGESPLVLCDHEWAIYDSGWSRYEYCTKCDLKNS